MTDYTDPDAGQTAKPEPEKVAAMTVAGPPPSAAWLRDQAAQLLAQAGEAERAEARALMLAREAARPQMPEVTDDQPVVVGFGKYQSGREYAFAALGFREGRSVRWVVTGSETRRFNWPGLLEFIGEANWPTLVRMDTVERLGLPWRTFKGRAECAVCRRRYAPKLDGRVRRHPTADVFLPVKHIDKPE